MRAWPVALGIAAVLGAAAPTSRSVAEQVVADRAGGCRIRDQHPDARKSIRPTGKGEFITAMGIRYAARVEANGDVRPGPMLSPGGRPPSPQPNPQRSSPPQTAERPPPPESLDE